MTSKNASFFLALISATFLCGCATPIPYTEMMANPNVFNQLDNDMLKKNVAVGGITLSETMPGTGFVVTEVEFKKALEESMAKINWLSAKGKNKYQLDAHFVEFEQPFTLFNTKIFSVVNYTVINARSKKTLYSETIKIPCVIGMGEVYDAHARELATMKCSIKENVTHLFRDLNSKF